MSQPLTCSIRARAPPPASASKFMPGAARRVHRQRAVRAVAPFGIRGAWRIPEQAPGHVGQQGREEVGAAHRGAVSSGRRVTAPRRRSPGGAVLQAYLRSSRSALARRSAAPGWSPTASHSVAVFARLVSQHNGAPRAAGHRPSGGQPARRAAGHSAPSLAGLACCRACGAAHPFNNSAQAGPGRGLDYGDPTAPMSLWCRSNQRQSDPGPTAPRRRSWPRIHSYESLLIGQFVATTHFWMLRVSAFLVVFITSFELASSATASPFAYFLS